MQHLLSINDLTPDQIQEILDLSVQLQSNHQKPLLGKNILFVFEKPSLRTAVGTESAINQLGGSVIHVNPEYVLYGDLVHAKDNDKLKGREAMIDTVNNIAQWCDAIFARVFSHQVLTNLSSFDQLPIVNALSDTDHPIQALADFITIQNIIGSEKTKITFVGDANNVAQSLIECGLKLGHTMAFTGPEKHFWNNAQIQYFQDLASTYGGKFLAHSDPKKVLPGSQFIYADTFVSMGEESIYEAKLKDFHDYQVNESLMDLTKVETFFMHCLPAYRGVEVTDPVIDGSHSLIYQQAKNRMVSSKGLFTWLLT